MCLKCVDYSCRSIILGKVMMPGLAASLFSTYLLVSSKTTGSNYHGINEGKRWVNHLLLSGHFPNLIGTVLESDGSVFCYLSANCP